MRRFLERQWATPVVSVKLSIFAGKRLKKELLIKSPGIEKKAGEENG
jgi:hypothetical protein